jgi:hypothetical protein
MTRIDLMFYKDGTCNVTLGKTLEEDRAEEDRGGGVSTDIIAHAGYETSNGYVGLRALIAVNELDQEGLNGDRVHTTLETICSMAFRAGIERGRKST